MLMTVDRARERAPITGAFINPATRDDPRITAS
jgi:hypothetical protein